jgi:rhodanese-related sulfurtransferase
MGHIEGAIQYTPKADIASSTFLNTLPTDKTVVVYCYSGQTSANMAAYLRVLGYDAVSLLFGANGMIHDEMTSGKWSDTFIFDYPIVDSTK